MSSEIVGTSRPALLPGALSARKEIVRRLRSNAPFAFFSIDVNHLGPFVGACGAGRGNAVIRALADLLVESLRLEGGARWFAGHLGGGKFVAVVDAPKAPFVAQRLVSRFDEQAPRFCDASCRRRLPLLSLSIGIATSRNRKPGSYAMVARIAARMKNYCKSDLRHRLSRFAFDRRAGVREASEHGKRG